MEAPKKISRILAWIAGFFATTCLGLLVLQLWLGDWFVPAAELAHLNKRSLQQVRWDFYLNVIPWLLLGLLISGSGLLHLYWQPVRNGLSWLGVGLWKPSSQGQRIFRRTAVSVAAAVGVLAVLRWWPSYEEREPPTEEVVSEPVAEEPKGPAAVAAALLADGDALQGSLVALENREPPRSSSLLLRKALAAPFSTRLKGHTSPVTSTSFSPDGTRILTASEDATARIWDAVPGQFGSVTALRTLRGHGDTVEVASFSPDGRWVLTASADRTARIWDAETGAVGATLVGHLERIVDASFSPDSSQIVTASVDRTARIWDKTGTPLAVLRGHQGALRSASFVRGGSQIVTASEDGTVVVWNAPPGTTPPIAVLEDPTSRITDATPSPDGSFVVTISEDGMARMWSAKTGWAGKLLRAKQKSARAAWIDPSGSRALLAHDDGLLQIWDGQQGAVVQSLQGHTEPVSAAAFPARCCRVLTASEDRTARLWDGESGATLAVLAGHRAPVAAAALNPDGSRAVTAAADTPTRVWDIAHGEPIATIERLPHPRPELVFSPDSSRIALLERFEGTTTGAVKIRDVESGVLVAALEGTSPSFHPDGSRIVTLVSSLDWQARIWDVETGSVLRILKGPPRALSDVPGYEVRTFSPDTGLTVEELKPSRALTDVSFSPDGSRIVAASSDGPAWIWSAETGEVTTHLVGHTRSCRSASFSPDGSRVVTASDDTTARIWDAATGEALVTLEGHTTNLRSASFNFDGSRVQTTAAHRGVKIWNTQTGKVVLSLDGVASIASFSPDGSRLVAPVQLSRGRIATQIWDAETGEILATVEGSSSSAVFSPDGSRILTTARGAGKVAGVWDAGSGELVASLEGHAYAIKAVFSPDGSRIATIPLRGPMLIWAHAADDVSYLRGRIRARTQRCLSPDQRQVLLDEHAVDAERRHAACIECVASFFQRLAGARKSDARTYEDAWSVYEECFLAREE